MFSVFNTNKLSSTESVDVIEKIVYDYLRPLGFRKHGRTLHRFVDGDISQVVNFQNGCPSKGVYDILWINLGIRVPECVERKFNIDEPLKKYYHEYECNIRTRLGSLVDGKDTFYNLKRDPMKIGRDIVERLKKYVIPVFDLLNSRDAILKRRIEYTCFDQFNNHLILLEEAMIVGRRGNLTEATRLFNLHYQDALAEYNHDLEQGTKTFLKKGEHMVYRNAKTNETETITATKSGYVTTYCANKGHITYLEKLAQELGIIIS
ncbi:MAG: DUF4304 domain-containing protein [Clostridia bacterium]|nr:DUF4304 domain-containing protein [Clostridia bacterium]